MQKAQNCLGNFFLSKPLAVRTEKRGNIEKGHFCLTSNPLRTNFPDKGIESHQIIPSLILRGSR